MRDKRAKYRRWAVVYAAVAGLLVAALVIVIAGGAYKTAIGIICSVVLTAEIVLLTLCSAYMWREGWREE
nr:MAG TPA: SMODS and SLOG-associating 2TM effector domain 2 [Caudoviricetes sp.]